MSQFLFFSCLLIIMPLFANTNEVHVSLDKYNNLVNQLEDLKNNDPNYALSKAKAHFNIKQIEQAIYADVTINFHLRIHKKRWTMIPLIPANVAITDFKVKYKQARLSRMNNQLVWSVDKPGDYLVHLSYTIKASKSAQGWVINVPLPPVPSTELLAKLPQKNIEYALIPSGQSTVTIVDEGTHINTTIPYTPALQLSWQEGLAIEYIISRANYQGKQSAKTMHWKLALDLQSFTDKNLLIPLLPTTSTLLNITVNDHNVPVIIENNQYCIFIKGKKTHKIELNFQTYEKKHNGPPEITLNIPEIPISSFSVALEGEKELNITPSTSIDYTQREGNKVTLAKFYLPKTKQLKLTWIEAIPETAKEDLRANAKLYHSVYAEEGVLHGTANAVWEISRGETSVLSFRVPENVQINAITSEQGSISDWKSEKKQHNNHINIFLDHKIKGQFTFNVQYEQLLSEEQADIIIPYLKAENVNRQRGMLALLAGSELALTPTTNKRMIKVGENQLPSFMRNNISKKILHTFKYSSEASSLVAKAIKPERKEGKFDVTTDTLISIGEAGIKGASSLEFNVKTGNIMNLVLELPIDVNLLSLNGPSIRPHTLSKSGDKQLIKVEFTQEMSGQFRLKLRYEKLLEAINKQPEVPAIRVQKADIDHGRIAIEALAAVEVQAAKLDNLFVLDLNELPRQLILQTTNPILLAYRYPHPPFKLALTVTHHKELDVQVAMIEKAEYHTLITKDGMAITTAKYRVKNSRKQFLRLDFSAKIETWSLTVGGQEQKPAKAKTKTGYGILIKLKNSTTGFPIELVYAEKLNKIIKHGQHAITLPKPNINVTESVWHNYLPDNLRYHHPKSNMTIVNKRGYLAYRSSLAQNQNNTKSGLNIKVPARGWMFSMNKLFADQSETNLWFTVEYITQNWFYFGQVLSVLSVLLIALGIYYLAVKTRLKAVFVIIPGIAGLFLCWFKLASGWLIIAYSGIFSGIFLMILFFMQIFRTRRLTKAKEHSLS